jgi:hypothetical protein
MMSAATRPRENEETEMNETEMNANAYTGTSIDIIGDACLPYCKPGEYLHTTLRLRAGVSAEVVESLCRQACEDAQRLWGFSNLRAVRWHHAGQSDSTIIYKHTP